MTQIIKRYSAKLGEVTITKYDENGRTSYHVKHSSHSIPGGAWYDNKRDAIIQAQFLAGKY